MKKAIAEIPFVLLGVLILLPLSYAFMPTWQDYLRLGIINIGLGYLWWRYPTFTLRQLEGVKLLLVVTFFFIVIHFDPVAANRPILNTASPFSVYFIVWGGGVSFAFAIFVLYGNAWNNKLALSDWIVIVINLLLMGLSLGAGLLFGEKLQWVSSVKCMLYLMLWFLVTRLLPSRPGFERKLIAGILVVFAFICLVGGVRIGKTIYHYRAAIKSQTEDAREALAHYEHAEESSRSLGLAALQDASLFRRAGLLYKQNAHEQAAKIFSMEEDFIKVVQPKEWEGPAGGKLYKNISCWKDLKLFEGKVEIKVFARGKPALDIWPRMRVKIEDRILGEVDVTSKEFRPYVFHTFVKTGRQRLEISFLNDAFNLQPHWDRSLWIEQAEIHYQEIAWK